MIEAVAPAPALSAPSAPEFEAPNYWCIKCPTCFRRSVSHYGTKAEAAAVAMKHSGFRRVGEVLFCRKCWRKQACRGTAPSSAGSTTGA